MLIDGLKFDLRLYLLVTSCDPLRLFLFKDGLVRFKRCVALCSEQLWGQVRLCTQPYSEPVTKQDCANLPAHLTNYAINKDCADFKEASDAYGQDESSKRSINWLMNWLKETHGEAKVRHTLER